MEKYIDDIEDEFRRKSRSKMTKPIKRKPNDTKEKKSSKLAKVSNKWRV